MFNPIIVLYNYFPEKLAFRVLLVAIMAASFTALFDLLWRKGKLGRNKARLYMVLFLYLLGLFFVIVLGRRTRPNVRIELDPFADYIKLLAGSGEYLKETALNVAAFVPVGFLAYIVAEKARFLKAVLSGLAVSMLFEFLQFVMKNGLCEVRDIINNTAGALLGAVLGVICVIIIKKRKAD